MRAILPFVAGIALVLCAPETGVAQTDGTERRHADQARMALAPTELAILKGEKRLVVDYGIWINHLLTDFKDDDNDSALSDATDATYVLDQRIWWRLTLRPPADGTSEQEHSLYVRFKDQLAWRDPADSNGRHDHDGPHVDYLFLSLDLRPHLVQTGRRFYGVGQGLAYSNVGDGVEWMASFATWSVMGFVSRTLPHEDNLDRSVPGGKDSGRTYYGLEGRYIGIPSHGLYGFLLMQRDDADEEPGDPAQDYDYDSEYFGIGSEGTLLPNLRYAAEAILETGESVTSGTNLEEEIRAWATDVSLVYDVQMPLQPTLYAEYAFGSGDADRAIVTDTIGGNAGGDDTNFHYFGYLPTGYALSPRVSNLHMFKVGMALKPFEGISRFNLKELSVSIDLYRYRKDEAAGGIFDLDASLSNHDIGQEIDLTVAWPILSDLSLTIEYGHFEPGDAYPATANDATEYVSLGVSTTF